MDAGLQWILLGIIASVVVNCGGETCHVQPECSCSETDGSYISCSSRCGPNVPKFAASKVQFRKLTISGSRETTAIRDGTFTELNVKTLQITDTGIDEIGCDAFDGLDLGLKTISLYRNFLSSIPNCTLARFQSVEYLDLSQNRITSVPTDSFVSFTRLRTLRLQQNRIVSIEPGAFHGLAELTYIFLYGNELVYLDTSTFNGADALTTLHLENNNLSSIHVRAFDGLEKLKYLYIHENKLTNLDDTLFHTTGELSYLNLATNQLTALGDTIFSNSKKLGSLYLSNNHINSISDTTFSGLDQLATLYLDNNWLEDLHSVWFKDTTNLRTLSLSKNNITQIPMIPFQTLRLLQNLDLSYNEIRVIDKQVFKGLGNVTRLNLRNNRLTEITEDSFLHCLKIYDIYLSHNAIRDVRQASFRNLSRLGIIDLANNRITQIVAGTFSNVTRLNKLILNDNRVSSISERLFEKMEPSLNSLELRNNGLSSTSLNSLGKVLVNLTRLNTLDLSDNPLFKISEGVLSSLQNINNVKLRNCSIQFITNETANIFSYKWDLRENMLSTLTSIQVNSAYFNLYVNISHNLIPELNVDVLDSRIYYGKITADNNKIQNGFTLKIIKSSVDLSISLRSNLLQKGIQILFAQRSTRFQLQNLDLSDNKFTEVKMFPLKLLGNFSWDPCNSSLDGVLQFTVSSLNLSNNAISSISTDACLGSVNTLDLRNNRLEVLGKFMTSAEYPHFRLRNLYLSGNRIHRVSPDTFGDLTRHYSTLDLRDNRLVGLANIRPILETRNFFKLYLSGNPLECQCDIKWLRNDTVRQKLDSVRCQSPSSAARYLAWCFPLSGCSEITPMRLTEVTTKICEMDSNIKLSNLSVTTLEGVTNVTWTKTGPGTITGFRLEFHPVDDVETRHSLLVHRDAYFVVVADLEMGKTYNICVTAELPSTTGVSAEATPVLLTAGSVACVQTSLSLGEAYRAGLPLVAGLGSGLGVAVIVALLSILCLALRQSKPNCCQRKRGPVSTPPAISEINDRRLNAYTPKPEHEKRMSDESLYEDVDYEQYENTGFNEM